MAAGLVRAAMSSFRRVANRGHELLWLISLNRGAPFSTVISTSKVPADKGFADRSRKGLRRPKRQSAEPRTDWMRVDQEWAAVYPTALPFRPTAVPLPVRMGYPVKRGVPPEKKGNLELVKVPNFLHLTPAAIKKHCEALKPFCTEWPAALASEDECEQYFPVQVQSTDYVSAGTSLRNSDARKVTLRVKLSRLNLDEHARKKLVRLTGDRYCKATDTLTITTQSCPMRQQNYDYAHYLLTVLFHESWKTELWEQDQTRADMEEYVWEGSPSQQNLLHTLERMQARVEERTEEVQEYRDALMRMRNEGESESSVLQYRNAVRRVLHL